MKKVLLLLLLSLFISLFATDMVIHLNDGSIQNFEINEIESITFSNETEELPHRVLFIGNSYTYFNGGVNIHLQNLVSELNDDLQFIAEAHTQGGATLEMHYHNDNVIQLIETGRWDYVVLQEQSTMPVEDPEFMFQYARLLDGVITDSGAETAFFMTWAREYDPEMIEPLAASYTAIAEELDAELVPCGRAFEMALTQDDFLVLHAPDGSHPNQHGTYLATCTFYAELFGTSPEGAEYVNDDLITEEEREFLQSVAWSAALQY